MNPDPIVIAFPGGRPSQRPALAVRVNLNDSFGFDEATALFQLYTETDFPGTRGQTRKSAREYVRLAMQRMTEAGYSSFSHDSVTYLANHMAAKYTRKTVELYKLLVRRFLHWLYRTGRTERTIGEHVRWGPGKFSPRPEPFTAEEYHRLRAASAGTQFDWLCVLGWHTGMALIDACLLRWSEVDFHQCVIRKNREKTGVPFIVPFQPEDDLGMALLARRAATPNPDPMDYVEPDLGKGVMGPQDEGGIDGANGRTSRVAIKFHTICRKAKIPKGKAYHCFRRSFISALANSNLNTAIASKMSGHNDPKIFAQYVTPDVESMREGLVHAQAKHLGLAIGTPPPTELNSVSKDGPGGLSNRPAVLPDTVYELRYGLPRLPGNILVTHVRTAANIHGYERELIVTPCDKDGNAISAQTLLMYRSRLRSVRKASNGAIATDHL
jgi:integrase